MFDETYDYPKREVEDYRFAVENEDREEAVVVQCVYELEDDDVEAVTSVFGPNVLNSKTFTRSTYYGKAKNTFNFTANQGVTLKHLANNAAISEELKEALTEATTWDDFAGALEATEATEAVNALKTLVVKVPEKGLDHYICNSLIWPRAPKYLYFDEYYQMEGQADLNALIQHEDDDALEELDYPLIGLITNCSTRPIRPS